LIGLAAKPCVTHSAMASVTSGPNLYAEGAFVLVLLCRKVPLHPMSSHIFFNEGWLAQSSSIASCRSRTRQTNDFICRLLP
jgi:hypothetical protein